MKKHFGKCVIEAPRHNSSAASSKARDYGKLTYDDDGYDYDGFTHLPVSRKQEGYNKKLGDKDFTDKLGVIRGFLRSSCGKLWDDVYSEIAIGLGRAGSEGIRHIKDQHIDVAVNTYRGVDGKIYHNSDYGVRCIDKSYYRRDDFYVEPETGILRSNRNNHRRDRYKEPVNRNLVPVTETATYQRIDNIWYYMEYILGDDEVKLLSWKKQLNKKELKEFRCFAKKKGYTV